MTPQHDGSNAFAASPYSLYTSHAAFSSGSRIQVRIVGTYEGFLLQARVTNTTTVVGSWDTPPHGTRHLLGDGFGSSSAQQQPEPFRAVASPSNATTHTINRSLQSRDGIESFARDRRARESHRLCRVAQCTTLDGAVTHSSKVDKHDQNFTWIAPASSPAGSIQFVATVIKEKLEWQMNVTSSIITTTGYVAPSKAPAKTTTKKTTTEKPGSSADCLAAPVLWLTLGALLTAATAACGV
uniref:Uncharacterized protein LOC116955354 n=1 Tax=Petromyzon marinus TaxID=7757 RepID=A0AAJ7XGC9_PETMA|nr:uncharacterized protein LOC116955354 [Petromyzon marinus]